MKKDFVITIKISDEERREIDRRRKGVSKSTFIRNVLFGKDGVQPLSKQDKDTLQHTVFVSYLLRYLSVELKQADLILRAKTEAESWYDKHYIQKPE